MKTTRLFTITEARNKFHALLKMACAGDEVVIRDTQSGNSYVVACTSQHEHQDSPGMVPKGAKRRRGRPRKKVS